MTSSTIGTIHIFFIMRVWRGRTVVDTPEQPGGLWSTRQNTGRARGVDRGDVWAPRGTPRGRKMELYVGDVVV